MCHLLARRLRKLSPNVTSDGVFAVSVSAEDPDEPLRIYNVTGPEQPSLGPASLEAPTGFMQLLVYSPQSLDDIFQPAANLEEGFLAAASQGRYEPSVDQALRVTDLYLRREVLELDLSAPDQGEFEEEVRERLDVGDREIAERFSVESDRSIIGVDGVRPGEIFRFVVQGHSAQIARWEQLDLLLNVPLELFVDLGGNL